MIKIKDGLYITPHKIRSLEPWDHPVYTRRTAQAPAEERMQQGTSVNYENGNCVTITDMTPDQVFEKIKEYI